MVDTKRNVEIDRLTTSEEPVEVELDAEGEAEADDNVEASGQDLVVTGEETTETDVDLLEELDLRGGVS